MNRIRIKKRLFGQFYTPSPIVNLICRLAIRSGGDRVLDPAAGDGIFVRGAYERLLELDTSSNSVGSQIVAIEVDRNAYSKAKSELTKFSPTIFNANFFETKLGKFDAIIGNPPYVEHRGIPTKEKTWMRETALDLGGKQVKVDARADIYAYFITHSTKFLNEGALLGFIVSSSWLDSVWGRDLQDFILSNYMIHSIVAFGKDVFREALVETVVLLLTKRSGEVNAIRRKQNTAQFVFVKKELDIDDFVNLVQKRAGSSEDEFVKIVAWPQGDLHKTLHWSEIFKINPLLETLLSHKMLVPLQELADVDYSFKEGAYDFFVLSHAEATQWGIEEQYLKPIISSPADIHTLNMTPEDVREKILLVDEQKNELKGTNVLSYIQDGERKRLLIKRGYRRGKSVIGYNKLPTLRHKKLWYSLRRRSPCPILVPAFVRNRFFALKNDARAYATANFYGIRPHNDENVTLILAYLNSSLATALVELKGKTSLGRGLLDIRSYVLRSLPVPNFRRVDVSSKIRLGALFRTMCKAQRAGDLDLLRKTRTEIDREIFQILKIRPEQAERVTELIKESRLSRNGRLRSKILVLA